MKILKLSRNWGLIIIIVLLVLAIFFIAKRGKLGEFETQDAHFWEMQSIDTVKYSRDLAGQYLNNPEFDKVIEDQVAKIADTGATHIALGTPYDEHFVPFLRRWVDISRKHGLKVWFRGNFSGWEEWFEYKLITREEHKNLLKTFIKNNGDLFEDGDIFSSCTECENGGPGDPRHTKDVIGHRQFLIDEYQIGKNEFRLVGKNVSTNYFPMNYDVASLIMDQETTKALGGIVVIDHYVGSSTKTSEDVSALAEKSGGKIVIGEFGAPIPDIHGEMSEQQQADWINETFLLLSQNKNVVGVNYWTAFGGSTKLWNDSGSPRVAVSILKKFYNPKFIRGYVFNEILVPIKDANIQGKIEKVSTNSLGQFNFPYLENISNLEISANGYYPSFAQNLPSGKVVKIILKAKNPNFLYNLQKWIYNVILNP